MRIGIESVSDSPSAVSMQYILEDTVHTVRDICTSCRICSPVSSSPTAALLASSPTTGNKYGSGVAQWSEPQETNMARG